MKIALAVGPRGFAGKRPLPLSAVGSAVSIPWCCVVPATLAAGGVVSSVAASWLARGTPFLLVLAIVSFSRAHYLIWFCGHGSPRARVLTILLTVLAAVAWAVRFSPRLAEMVMG